jgi:DNA helicase-2/ATP-dependent DNA helicase PcrA
VMVGADDFALVGPRPKDEDLREARRKFYVSMTRAKDEVHLVHTDYRIGRNGEYRVYPSRFIAELNL